MKRLDVFVTERGLARSRSQAADLIKRGKIKVDGKTVLKPSYKTPGDAEITVSGEAVFVSRAAEKLLKAVNEFGLDFKEKICLDIGSSTGGFTQVMLEYGAKKVYAVDVGTDQMHGKIKNNPRVILLEQTDARSLTKDLIPEKADFFTVDVSFISVKKVLPFLEFLFHPTTEGIILVKPQFEAVDAGEKIKNGIVRSRQARLAVLNKTIDFLSKSFFIKGFIQSPLTGKEGNTEYLVYVSKEV